MTNLDGAEDRARAVVLGVVLMAIGLLVFCIADREGLAEPSLKEERCTESIPDVFDRVSPAVVFIATTAINPYNALERVSHTVGSGMIVDASGLILTNSHVVYSRQVITVTLDDGTSLPAQLVGIDPIFDLALIRITPPSSGRLPTATLGDSDRVHVGEEVLVVGNPLGLDQTLTHGIVSAINRTLPDTPFSLQEPLIQTDAPINPGNSGGPLLNRCGEVIGITTAMIMEAQNIGFAIPSNLAKTVLPSLQNQGRVVRPWLGVQGQLVNRAVRDLFRVPLVDGLLVEVVEPGSPAERAGLRGGQLEVVIDGRPILLGGDIITTVNSVRLMSPDALVDVMRALKVGSKVHLTVYREGTTREVDCVLPERPALPGDLPEQRTLAPVTRRGTRLVLPGLFP